jgi:hypothetical protein
MEVLSFALCAFKMYQDLLYVPLKHCRVYLFHEGGLKIKIQELVQNFSGHRCRELYFRELYFSAFLMKIEQLPYYFEYT